MAFKNRALAESDLQDANEMEERVMRWNDRVVSVTSYTCLHRDVQQREGVTRGNQMK